MKALNDGQQIVRQVIFVSIDSYIDKAVVGRFWNGCRGEETPFNNLMQLLLLIDKILEEQGFPEAQHRCKRFAGGEAIECSLPMDPVELGKPSCGVLASFRLKILFRQNASWQGIITWTESRHEQSFRSALELVMIMDSALTNAAEINRKQIG